MAREVTGKLEEADSVLAASFPTIDPPQLLAKSAKLDEDQVTYVQSSYSSKIPGVQKCALLGFFTPTCLRR